MDATILRPTSTKRIFLAALFTVITIAPLFMVHSQWLTGPLVNAMLILTCVLVGPMEAIILGVLPSSVALASGLLPLPLAPMIPFIIMSNALFIASFTYLRKTNEIIGIIVGAFLKFVFLTFTVRFLMISILDAPIITKLSLMMSWPQFATALIGGIIALSLLSILPCRD